MNYLENRVLRSFVAVAEEQQFARAAKRLGVTPATLSRRMKKLESQLDAKLLERTADRKIVVTASGQRFLTGARETLRLVEEAVRIARLAGSGELGRARLGFMASLVTSGLLTNWIGPFGQAHPQIDLTLHNLPPMAQIDGILREELDVAFTRTPRRYPAGVRGFEIYRQPLALALPKKHALAQHEAISPAMLAGEAFVGTTVEPDIGFFGYTDVIARIGNFRPRVIKRHEDLETALVHVSLGHGIAVVPETVKTMTFFDVAFRNIAADPVPQTSVAFVYGRNPSPSIKLLIRHMKQYADCVAPPMWSPKFNSFPRLVYSRETS